MRLPMLLTVLPGPSRRRVPTLYRFQRRFVCAVPGAVGCVSSWEVLGGREGYQVDLERTEAGDLAWHCTCPDAVYRGEVLHGHTCKHIRGLQVLLEPTPQTHRQTA